jgi:predicted neuraminidase
MDRCFAYRALLFLAVVITIDQRLPAAPPTPKLIATSTVFEYPQDDPYDRSNLYGFNHAPSVVRLADGRLLASWFSGPFEASVHQVILGAYSDDEGATWSKEVLLNDAPRRSDFDPAFITDGGRTWLFFTVGRWDRYPFVGLRDVEKKEVGVASYKLYARTTDDSGHTWGDPVQVIDKVSWGSRSNGIKLATGELVLPVYHFSKQTAAVVRSQDGGQTWQRHGNVLPEGKVGANEPTIAQLPDGELLMVVRSRKGFLWQSRSQDRGITWSEPVKTDMIAAASSHNLYTTKSDHLLLTHNACAPPRRTPLTIRASDDGGKSWGEPLTLVKIQHPTPDEEVFSRSVCYPSVTELSDGSLLVVWTKI